MSEREASFQERAGDEASNCHKQFNQWMVANFPCGGEPDSPYLKYMWECAYMNGMERGMAVATDAARRGIDKAFSSLSDRLGIKQ